MAIHRFKCSVELNQAIIQFSNMHKFDDSDLLDIQFKEWRNSPAIHSIVESEKNFLSRHHYETDIDVKIFKSIKYYYIKKFLKPEVVKEKKARNHQLVPKELKEAIQADLEKRFTESSTFKPSDTFERFDISGYSIPPESIKKCYKNQYYQMKQKKYAPTLDA